MKNKATIVRDNDNNVYLLIGGKPLTKSVCFRIEEFITEPNGDIIQLGKEFDIDLSGGR